MTYAVRAMQARCAALGCDPGPIDGVMGRRTRAAEAEARTLQAGRRLPFVHASGISRLHVHWTAGGPKAGAEDRKHYHVVVEQDGGVLRLHDPARHLAHTLNANGGAVGISACGMAGSTDRPWSLGKHPVTVPQMAALAREVARLCATYDVPVSRWSVLTHAEVQPTLGIAQRQKWDVCWLPGMAAPADPLAMGDKLRAMVSAALASLAPVDLDLN